MAHSEIASVAEPWLMLPLVYSTKKRGVLSEYGHMTSSYAINDFIENLPNKKVSFNSSVNKFLTELYQMQCQNGETYFLDKTPRYYLIIPEILKIFPDAKFIFLSRNPLHVLSSMIETWSNGSLKRLYSFKSDINHGIKSLSHGYNLCSDRAFFLQYESFVQNPEKSLQMLCQYLDIDYESSMLDLFVDQDTKGRMGDPTGVLDYNKISTSSLAKWQKTISTSYRKKFAIKIIKSIDTESLATQGYDKQSIIKSIEELDSTLSFGVKDRLALLYSLIVEYSKANIFFGETTKRWLKDKYLS
jgi:hypothetical protein